MYLPTGAILIGVEVNGGERGGDLDCGTDLLKEKSLSLVQWALIPLYPGPDSHVSFCWKE